MAAYTIDLKPIVDLNDEQFELLCAANPEIKFERTPKEELVIMPPTGGETGRSNSELNADFVIWNRQYKLGYVFDSSTCFRLTGFGGGDRSPDISWIEKSRWEALSADDRRKFPPITPDFVLELISPTDSLYDTREKMQEYMTAGVRLGWLINPKNMTVEIYRQGATPEILEQPTAIAEESVLPGFELSLGWLWNS
jgi:Uma2 family endonuclease